MSINDLKTSCLDKSDVPLAFNGNSNLSKTLVFILFMFNEDFSCPIPVSSTRRGEVASVGRVDKPQIKYGKFSEFQICFCGLDPGNLKSETVRTDKRHVCF